MRIIYLLILFAFSYGLKAQSGLIQFNEDFYNRVGDADLKNAENSFLSLKPLLKSDFSFDIDSVLYLRPRDAKIIGKLKHPIWWEALRTRPWVTYQQGAFSIQANPRINFTKSTYNKDVFLSQNTRGFDIQGSVGNSFSFGTGFSENQAFFPDYYAERVKNRNAIPGKGRKKNFKTGGYDFSEVYAYVSFSPAQFLNLQLGQGKQFIGNGYRSLVQSYNAGNMPYVKISTTLGKFRYSNIIQAFQNITIVDGTSEIEKRRYNSVHTLSFLLGDNLEINLIESILFPHKKSSDYFPNINLYNPIIGYRTIQYGYDSRQNVLSALNLRFDVLKALRLYSQIVYTGAERYGFQLGFKSYRVFNMPLMLQCEYNQVQPFTFSHSGAQSFVHANQEVIHPLGANFREGIFKASYHWKDFYITYQLNYAQVGFDSTGFASGQNILQPYTEPLSYDFLQGQQADIINQTIALFFLINPSSNMKLFLRYRSRIKRVDGVDTEASFVSFGIKTNLRSVYDDF